MSHRVPTAVVVLLLAASPAAAQLDPEPKTPYLWRVVLKVQPHPLLSGAFREQLKRDLGAALQPALGPLGTVEVVDLADLPRDKWDPLWQQFEDRGFAALDATRDLTGAKTHFLKLDYKDGQYLLESRQHDGFAGLASPVVRKQSVRAPELVGRTAGLMLDRDFGLVGTVEPGAGKGGEVKVHLRAGQLGPVDRFVKAGDVFALSQVFKTNRPAPEPVRTATGKLVAPPAGSVPPPGLAANPRQFTLLRVKRVARDGELRCESLTAWTTAMPTTASNLAGYRCMKLGTVEAPLSVRLVGSDTGKQPSVEQVKVRATEAGFDAPPGARDAFTFKDGLYRSARPLANVACVVVSLEGVEGKQFPVPILGPEPVNLPFETNRQAAERAAFVRDAVATASRVADAREAQTICFEATAKLIDKQKNAEALARAKGGLQAADTAEKGITDDVARLKERASLSPDGPKLVAAIEQNLVAMRKFNGDLREHVKTLEKVVARENDPSIAAREVQAQAINARIAVLLARGDADEAISAYDQLVTLDADDADAKAKRDKLKELWKAKSPAHEKARDYLLKTWPAVATIPDLKDSLPQIGAAVDECLRNKDHYTLRKLLTIFTGSIVKLKELNDQLDPNADADRKLAADAKAVGEAMAALENKIREFVEGKKE
jgi:tetratricopeptide (TPR) repeat protein